MGHGTVADEVKGRRLARAGRRGRMLEIEEEGVTFRSYVDGSERFMAPETSMEIQAALGSDIALVFDECTPFHVDRDYTARSTERTHRWLDRCLRLARVSTGPREQLVYGIVQGGVYEDLRVESAQSDRRQRLRRDRDRRLARRRQGADVRGRRLDDRRAAARRPAAPPAGHRRDRRPRRRRRAGASTRSTARCRRGSGATAMALVPDPEQALARRPDEGALARQRRADHGGLPVPGLRDRLTRGYLRYMRTQPRADRRCGC